MTEWNVGDEVLVYPPFSSAPIKKATVQKIYKNGHIIVGGVRYGKPHGDTAFQAGERSSYWLVKRITDKNRIHSEGLIKRLRITELIRLLRHVNPEDVPDDMLDQLIDDLTKACDLAQGHAKMGDEG